MLYQQLTLPLYGDSRAALLPDPVADEIRALRALRLPCMQDLDSQISRNRVAKYYLRQRHEREIRAWQQEGCPGIDDERDARLIAINTEIIQLERCLEHLEEERNQRLRLTYLEQR